MEMATRSIARRGAGIGIGNSNGIGVAAWGSLGSGDAAIIQNGYRPYRRLSPSQTWRAHQSTQAEGHATPAVKTATLDKPSSSLSSSPPSSSSGELSPLPPHSLLPTKMLLRSLLVMAISSKPFLLGPALRTLTFLNGTKISFLKVDRNPLLHAILKRTMYEHFCAGENGPEVRSTVQTIHDMGFRGVILTYAREIVTDASTKEEKGVGVEALEKGTAAVDQPTFQQDSDIDAWRKGVLETLDMISETDFLALKLTGAGPATTAALTAQSELSEQMNAALDEICSKAVAHSVRILVDAEQQSVQPAIDGVALKLMRRFNRQPTAVVYNTYQAYLKSTPQNLTQHLSLAANEGFTLGVKLVRGAYMGTEPRERINDTKEDTDHSYDDIAAALIRQEYYDGDSSSKFPTVNLFLATHNKHSVLAAHALQSARHAAGQSNIPIQYGQLLGMADEVSCSLLQLGQSSAPAVAPQVYKCLSWGTLEDCLSYLLRRAVENRDAVARTKTEYAAVKREVWRRLKRTLRLSSSSPTPSS